MHTLISSYFHFFKNVSLSRKTDFKSYAVIRFSVAHQHQPEIEFLCVAMERWRSWKLSMDSLYPSLLTEHNKWAFD